jgi:hypothetical protein
MSCPQGVSLARFYKLFLDVFKTFLGTSERMPSKGLRGSILAKPVFNLTKPVFDLAKPVRV